jgi:type IV fimbrial biogenesis protein FimT
MKGIKGFTLVELMVVLAVAGILLALTAPFGRYIRNTAATSYLHEFASTLNLARSTAITSGAQVVICRLKDTVDADGNPIKDCAKTNNGCFSNNANDVQWQGGWAVFIDNNKDCSITSGSNPDTMVRVYNTLPNGYTLTGGQPELVVFNSVGQVDFGNNTWTLSMNNSDANINKTVTLSRPGEVTLD